MQPVVICKLPKAGLGNQLFPLLKAACFAHLNNFPLLVVGYHQVRIGAYLRREKVKRNYSNYFKFQKDLLSEVWDLVKIRSIGGPVINEPEIKKEAVGNSAYLFSKIPHWSNMYHGLKDNRDMVTSLFYDLVNAPILAQLEEKTYPCIGVHIRMGDFRALAANEDFSKVGGVRTPEDYFVEMITEVRRIKGVDMPVTIFTDGHISDLKKITGLGNVSFETGNQDIVDMLLLSKSKIILTSAGSTFSYWSAFLSNAPVIMHPDHIHSSIRDKRTNALWYEGKLDKNDIDPLLLQNILSI